MSIQSTGSGKRFGRIPEATAHSGLSRSSLYKLAAIHAGLFRKHGSATIVDFQVLNRILEAAPAAELTTPNTAA
jgi:hypothetical protein